MDFNLSERERMVQAAAKEFAQKAVLPQATQIDFSAALPLELAREMGRMGYYGPPYPGEYGGGRAGYAAYVLVSDSTGMPK